VAVGRTVRPLLENRPPGRPGPSAQLEGKRGNTGCSGANNRPSVLGCRIVRAPRGPSAWAPRTVRACRARMGPRSRAVKEAGSSFSSPTRPRPPLLISLLLSLKKRLPPWGFRLGHSPDSSSTSPDSSRGSPPCHPGLFSNISFSLSRILSKKVIRVW
jgi:hypothetical protein